MSASICGNLARTGHLCTLPPTHDGNHEAVGAAGIVLMVWGCHGPEAVR